MKNIKVALTMLVVMALGLAVLAAPNTAQAAGSTNVTITITEQQIAEYFAKRTPSRGFSNVKVDLQTGQVTLSFTLTDKKNKKYDVVSVWVPNISSAGTLSFTLQSATSNGKTLSQEVVTRINLNWSGTIARAVREYILKQIKGTYTVSSVVISEKDITIVTQVARP
jgi:spermidine/putrescine-binding protein